MEAKRFLPFHSWLSCLVLAALLTASCGTILYPERHGQVSGRVDPGVVVMDGVCLFFFLIPGIIAFAVDFSTGAIYYPPGRVQGTDPNAGQEPVVFHADPEDLTSEGLAQLVLEHTGKEIDLLEESLQLYRVESREQIADLFESAASTGALALDEANPRDCPIYRPTSASFSSALTISARSTSELRASTCP